MIESMKSNLDVKSSKYVTYPKFVFLCGKAYSENKYDESNRGIIDAYLKTKTEDAFIVLSEKMWEDNFNSSIDLLTFEEFLAEVSDTIILLAESPGTFCELGAFAYAEKLFSSKLIIVIDERYKAEKSFINTGPVAKAKKDGAKVISAPLKGTGLLSSAALRETIDSLTRKYASKYSLSNKKKPNTESNSVLINTFILEILELIKILEPISRKDLMDLYKRIKEFSTFTFVKSNGERFHSEIKYDYIIKLLLTVELIKSNDDLISLAQPRNPQSFMFNYSKKSENQERIKLICRKYRYGGIRNEHN